MKGSRYGCCATPGAGAYRIFRAPDDDGPGEVRHIVSLVNTWLESLDESRPDARSARRGERKLHDAIKASSLYGKILSFAGSSGGSERRSRTDASRCAVMN